MSYYISLLIYVESYFESIRAYLLSFIIVFHPHAVLFFSYEYHVKVYTVHSDIIRAEKHASGKGKFEMK